MNCIYCGKELSSKTKREHVINNSICGWLVSSKICCSECNSVLGRTVDNKFVSLFKPILKQEYNLHKTQDSSKWPRGNTESTRDIFKNPYLYQGIQKIALEFAVYCMRERAVDIPLELLQSVYEVKHTPEKKIDFSAQIIPFLPLNPVDKFLELSSPFYLTHKLILFTSETALYCYVELFSTYQFYVQLCSHYSCSENIYECYVQNIQEYKILQESTIYDLKDLDIVLTENHIDYKDPKCLDALSHSCHLSKEEKEFLSKSDWMDFLSKSRQTNTSDVEIDPTGILYTLINHANKDRHYGQCELASYVNQQITPQYSKQCDLGNIEQQSIYYNAITYYFNDDDELRHQVFRSKTPLWHKNYSCVGIYPEVLAKKAKSSKRRNKKVLQQYWHKKEQRLFEFLKTT